MKKITRNIDNKIRVDTDISILADGVDWKRVGNEGAIIFVGGVFSTKTCWHTGQSWICCKTCLQSNS